jgi:hypothetical protein
MAIPICAPVLRRPGEVGLEFEEVFFSSMDGVPLEGWFIPADSDKLVIHNHFLPGNRYGYPGHLPEFGGLGGFEVNFLPEYKALHDAGYNILCYDIRNHGLSGSGNGDTVGIGLLEYRDVIGSVRYAKSRPDTASMCSRSTTASRWMRRSSCGSRERPNASGATTTSESTPKWRSAGSTRTLCSPPCGCPGRRCAPGTGICRTSGNAPRSWASPTPAAQGMINRLDSDRFPRCGLRILKGDRDMAWNRDQLEQIGQAEELHITSYRRDGTLRRWTPIWVVRVGDDLYIRSARGRDGGWYRHATRNHAARIRAGDLETDVTLQLTNDAPTNAQVEAAYRSKYQSQTSSLGYMTTPTAAETTLRLVFSGTGSACLAE